MECSRGWGWDGLGGRWGGGGGGRALGEGFVIRVVLGLGDGAGDGEIYVELKMSASHRASQQPLVRRSLVPTLVAKAVHPGAILVEHRTGQRATHAPRTTPFAWRPGYNIGPAAYELP